MSIFVLCKMTRHFIRYIGWRLIIQLGQIESLGKIKSNESKFLRRDNS